MNTARNTGKISSSFFIPRENSRSSHLMKRVRMLPLYSFPHHKDIGLEQSGERNRFFMHLDLDCFFAQVEQRDNPKLRGRPISVGGHGENKGIVMTASYEARAYGVAIGMSVVDARKLCPNLISIPCYGTKYEAIVLNILENIRKRLPDDCVEQYSIDECFLDISPVAKNYWQATKFAAQVIKMVRDLEHLHVSVGVSFTKSYAKMATKFNKPRGLTVIREDNRDNIYKLPIEKMWGIGQRMKIRMQSLGLHTIGDLANASIYSVHKEFGINGVVLRRSARGEEKGSISGYAERVEKSFSHNHTLSNAIHKKSDALDEIKRMTEYICRRMRGKDLIADHIALSVRYQDLGYSGGKQRLYHPTNSEKELYHRALEIFEALPEPSYNHKVRAFGIAVYDLYKVSGYNLDFFNREHLIPYKQIDMLKDKYGENIIRMGVDAS